MEIEAKFNVPDEGVLQRLIEAETLAGYALSFPKIKRMHDVFLDTPDRLILASRHVCRQRDLGDRVVMTLKSGGRVEGAIHTRQELELTLPAPAPVSAWPDSALTAEVRAIVGGATLQPLFAQDQVRAVRVVSQADRVVGEFSADRVELRRGDQVQVYFEVEIELKGTGTLTDLNALADCLKSDWQLAAQAASKFQRGLAFFTAT